MRAKREGSEIAKTLKGAGIYVQQSNAPTVRHTPAVRLYVPKGDVIKARKVCALGSPDGSI